MQVSVVRLRVIRTYTGDVFFLASAEFCLQRACDLLSDFGLDLKKIGDFSIISFCPQVRIVQRIDQLHRHADLVGGFLKPFDSFGIIL